MGFVSKIFQIFHGQILKPSLSAMFATVSLNFAVLKLRRDLCPKYSKSVFRSYILCFSFRNPDHFEKLRNVNDWKTRYFVYNKTKIRLIIDSLGAGSGLAGPNTSSAVFSNCAKRSTLVLAGFQAFFYKSSSEGSAGLSNVT